ncbi:MAG TPA: tetratricopeptide repeat protein [Usitatibacter sp.]|nr:tetratricopeptide repeat protein [Usitatibacter sp.]
MVSKRWLKGLAVAFAVAFAGAAGAQGSGDGATGDEATGDATPTGTDAMFEYLVAEFAAQRGDVDGALAIYERLARELHDPKIARRAVETAIRAREFAPALENAALLLELDPKSSLAREIMAALLVNQGDLSKARDLLEGVLEKTDDRGPILMQLSHLFGKFQDKAAVLQATRDVTAPYASMPESHYALGVAALVAGQDELAAQEADAALAARPDWGEGAVLKAQVLRETKPAEVVPYYEGFVAAHPDSVEARMQLGRELASTRKLAEARDQFRAVDKLTKSDPQPSYAIGLLSLQLEDYEAAQAAFTRALDLNYRDAAAIYLGMGEAAEGLKRYDEAIDWYKKVDSDDWVRAQLRIATIIARQQGLQAGRDYLHKIEPRSSEDSIQIIQVEAQLLREAKKWQETYDMLSEAVAKYPDSYELLYDRAMAAERIDKLDVMETDLRRVIAMKPDYAHAYNALGYTLAEKTDRLKEAKELIEKAYKLQPDDPFIQDSLGWVEYRLGHVHEALKQLQIAYSARPDPEIAAHLGEVLWKSGQHEAAEKIWRAALAENPNHESLLAVMQKYH